MYKRVQNQTLILLIMLFATFVGLYNLGDTRIAADELKAFKTITDRAPFEVVTYYHTSSHIFHSFLLALVHHFTENIYFFRLISVGFGVLAVAMTYRWGKSLVGSELALAVSFLLTMTPIFGRYLREIRGYSAMLLFGLIIFYSLWHALKPDSPYRASAHSRRYWGSFIIASILGLYTHFFVIFALLATAVIVLGEWLFSGWQWRRQLTMLRSYLISACAIAAVLLLLLLPLIPQIIAVPTTEGRYASDFEPFTPTWHFIQQYLDAFQLFGPLSEFKELPDIFFVLVLIGCLNNLRLPQRRRATLWLIVWWLVPFLAISLLLIIIPWSMAQARFYLYTLPAYLLLGLFGLVALSEAVTALGRRFWVVPESFARPTFYLSLIFLLLVIAAPRTIQLFGNLTRLRNEQAWTPVAAYLRTEIQANDIILCEAFELTGGDEDKCHWQLNHLNKLTAAQLPIQYFSQIANFRGAEKLSEILHRPGHVWFVLYFRQPPPPDLTKFENTPGFSPIQWGRTWIIRVNKGDSLLDNLLACGQWLLKNLPDEDHQFRYHLDLSQLYALAGNQKEALQHLEQAVQLQQASNEPERIPELRTTAAIVRYYAPAKPVPQQQLDVNFENRLKLYGYTLEPQHLSSHSSHQPSEIRLTLYWQVLGPPGKDYSVFVHVEDAAGEVVGHLDFQPFDAIYPTSFWPAGADLREARQLTLPDKLPPGTYHLAIGLYLPADSSRLKVMNDANSENAIRLEPFTITEPSP
ncbi:MAG: glycosyltransferase family 39 protein [Anaerolineae bacterium]